MKYDIVLSSRFKRDLKQAKRRGCDLDFLDEVVTSLACGKELSQKHRDHELSGDFKGFRECHIQPDWILIYRIEDNQLILFLVRTGSHSDLFG